MQNSERPDYVYDYHWGRIISFAAILLGAIAGTVYLFAGNNTPPETTILTQAPAETSGQPAVADKQDSPPLKAAPEKEVAIQQAATNETAPQLPTPKQVSQPSVTPDASNNETPQQLATVEKVETNKEQPKSTDSNPTQAKQEPQTKTVAIAEPSTRTKAKLFTDTIKRAKLTLEVKRHEPGENLPTQIVLDENGLSKVYFYTEVIGQAGAIHYHYWYNGDKLVAKVPINIHTNRFRCYSSKYLNSNHSGDWTVKVTDKQGKLLAKSEFTFLTPDAR